MDQQQHGVDDDDDDDALMVNYRDACVYGRDWKLVASATAWLNDVCIHYHFATLQAAHDDAFKNDESSKSTLLLDPAVISFFVHQCEDDDEVADFLRGYGGFTAAKRILVPINDSMAAGNANWNQPGSLGGGGTHWSLLVVTLHVDQDSRPAPAVTLYAHHFDSQPRTRQRRSTNAVAAQDVATKLQQALRWQSAQSTTTTNASCSNDPVAAAAVIVQECAVPQQRNGHDCGAHVLAAAEAVLSIAGSDADDDGDAAAQIVGQQLMRRLAANPNYCADVRRRVADHMLAQQQK